MIRIWKTRWNWSFKQRDKYQRNITRDLLEKSLKFRLYRANEFRFIKVLHDTAYFSTDDVE